MNGTGKAWEYGCAWVRLRHGFLYAASGAGNHVLYHFIFSRNARG